MNFDSPAAAPRIFAFAEALGLKVDQMVELLEKYDLHLLSGPAMREEMGVHALRSALVASRDFITSHPAVHGTFPMLVGSIDSALRESEATAAQ